ncbi:MAG TPA: hypothetical protein VGN61_02080, partial [Verrucomicrobiae bacterium]
YLFGERSAKSVKPEVSSTHFLAIAAPMTDGELTRLFFASDPAVFSRPSANGFSGRAWMDQPPVEFQSTNQIEAPLWLALDTTRLGTGFAKLNRADATEPQALGRLDLPQLEALPIFLPAENVPTQSVFRIEGELGGRLVGSVPALRTWSSAQLLTNTVVQIAVSHTGDVMATRLLARSGSTDADGDGLAKARALEFSPSADPRTVWAQAIFQWQTAAPARGMAAP